MLAFSILRWRLIIIIGFRFVFFTNKSIQSYKFLQSLLQLHASVFDRLQGFFLLSLYSICFIIFISVNYLTNGLFGNVLILIIIFMSVTRHLFSVSVNREFHGVLLLVYQFYGVLLLVSHEVPFQVLTIVDFSSVVQSCLPNSCGYGKLSIFVVVELRASGFLPVARGHPQFLQVITVPCHVGFPSWQHTHQATKGSLSSLSTELLSILVRWTVLYIYVLFQDNFFANLDFTKNYYS